MPLTTSPDAIGALKTQLAAFLLANVPGLASALDGWPNPNQQLNYPAISIYTKTPKFTPLQPYIVAKGNPDPATGLADLLKCVGMYDLEIQLDCWTNYKPQRDKLVEGLLIAFNKNADVPGVDLTLTDYYNETTHLSIDSMAPVDDEAADQRGEWRALITVVLNLRVVMPSTGLLIQTIENNLDVPSDSTVITDPSADVPDGIDII
jgi:hypothetical protein